ncbi:MAG: bifunctional oligoribonuclease/PAP phosphatase NrnA [Promethearchaeota archaeon]
MLKSKFKNFLSFIENKNITILTHDSVDIDGLVSCFTLKFFLNQLFENQEISIYFSELSKPTKDFIKKFSEKFPDFSLTYDKTFNISKCDLILIVDTNSLTQIKLENNSDFSSLEIPYIFIDHHFFSENSETNLNLFNFVFENYSSTVEIILDLFRSTNTQLTIPIKNLIIAAIITDTGFFKHANNRSIKNLGKLMCDDINIQDIFYLLKSDIDISEKIAKIKGMQRVNLIREKNYLIGITNVSSFDSSVATMLIKLGFDIAIVLSKEGNNYRINTRAKKGFCIKTGLHLGKILGEISELYEGNGGGHNGAASITIDKESNFIITQIIEKIKQYL